MQGVPLYILLLYIGLSIVVYSHPLGRQWCHYQPTHRWFLYKGVKASCIILYIPLPASHAWLLKLIWYNARRAGRIYKPTTKIMCGILKCNATMIVTTKAKRNWYQGNDEVLYWGPAGKDACSTVWNATWVKNRVSANSDSMQWFQETMHRHPISDSRKLMYQSSWPIDHWWMQMCQPVIPGNHHATISDSR